MMVFVQRTSFFVLRTSLFVLRTPLFVLRTTVLIRIEQSSRQKLSFSSSERDYYVLSGSLALIDGDKIKLMNNWFIEKTAPKQVT